MGYDVNRFVDKVDLELLCPICFNVLEDPIQIDKCEHAFCNECLAKWLSGHSSCPIDREKITVLNLMPVTRLLRVFLARLKMKCEHAADGCTFVANFESINAHSVACEFNPKRLLVCTNGCNFVLAQNELAAHDCTKALMTCCNEQKKQIQSFEKEIKKLKAVIKEQEVEIGLLKTAIDGNSAREKNEFVSSWSALIPSAKVTRWGLMISTPDEFLQTIIRDTISNLNCPESLLDRLMANCHEQSWPAGLRCLNTRQNNRRMYDNYVCKRVPGKQAVLILKCHNEHMSDDFIKDPGFVIIFASGIE